LARGEGAAAALLFNRYAVRLSRLAEEHLSQRLAGRLDGEDVVQSVFRTFFGRSARGEFRIDTSVQLWCLLVQITLRKVRTKARHHTAGVRNVAAESPLTPHLEPTLIAREPDPAEAAALVGEIEDLLRGLPALHGQVLELRLQGHGVAEIAPRLGVSQRTVYRTLTLLQERLAGRAAAPEAP
jgi:RNA polymerase sigma-70 factor (ECF subfamily)